MTQAQGTPRGDLLAIIQAYPHFSYDRFIGDIVAPITTPSGVNGDTFHWNYVPRQATMQKPDGSLVRGIGAHSKKISGGMKKLSGDIVRSSVEFDVDRDQESTAQEQQAAEVMAAAAVERITRVDHETEVANFCFNKTNFPLSGGSALGGTVSTSWANASSGKPVDDVLDACVNGINGTGIRPNAIIMTEQAHRWVSSSENVFSRLKGTDGDVNTATVDGLLQNAALQKAFMVPQILIPHVPVIDPNDPSVDTASQVWTGNYVFLCHIAPAQATAMPSLTRTFVNPRKGGFLSLDSYYTEGNTSQSIRAHSYRSLETVDIKLGHLIKIVP